MKTRIQFGLVELIAAISGTVIYYLLSMCQYAFFIKGVVVFGRYIFMPGCFLAVMSAVFGPSVGLIIGFAGQLLANMYIYGNTREMDIVVAIVIGIIVGIMKDRLKVLKGEFGIPEAIDLVAIHLFATILTLILFRPLAYLFFEGIDYIEALRMGIYVTVSNTIVMIAIGVPLLLLVSHIMRKLIVVLTLRGYRR